MKTSKKKIKKQKRWHFFLTDASGQALTEMAVMLVAIMVVFLGLIFAYGIGKTNIQSTIECYGKAGDYAYNGVRTDSGQQIISWDTGNDERLYTNDDIPLLGGNDNPELFRKQFIDNEGNIDLNGNFHPDYVINNFVPTKTNSDNIFLKSANLTSYSEQFNIYDLNELKDLKEAFSALVFSSDIIVKNSVYYPLLLKENNSSKNTERSKEQ